MKVFDALSVEQLSSVAPIWNKKISQRSFSLLQKLLTELGRLFSLELFFRPPSRVREEDAALWEVLSTVDVLKEAGIVDSFLDVLPTYPDEPQGHIVRSTIRGRGGLGYRGVGKDMFDKTKAGWASVGEALERWSLTNFYPPKNELVDTSYSALKGNKLELSSVVGFNENKKEKGHEEYNLMFDEHTPFRWTIAHSLTRGQELYVPLQLVSFGRCYEISAFYGQRTDDTEPLLTSIISSGAAAGQTREEAILHGVLELIERDTFMIYWFNSLIPKKIDISSIDDERVQRLAVIAKRYNLELHLLYFKSDFPVHTVGCVVRDRTGIGPAIYVDAKSGFDIVSLVRCVLNEALATRQAARRFLDTQHTNDKTEGRVLDVNYRERMLYWFDPRKAHEELFLTKGEEEKISTFPQFNAAGRGDTERLKYLTTVFKEKEFELFFKEVVDGTLKHRLRGMTAVVVKSPQLQPLFLDEGLATVADERVMSVPHEIGEVPAVHINTTPHPFL